MFRETSAGFAAGAAAAASSIVALRILATHLYPSIHEHVGVEEPIRKKEEHLESFSSRPPRHHVRHLEPLEGVNVIVIESYSEADLKCSEMFERCIAGLNEKWEFAVVGMDCEWTPPHVQKRRCSTATALQNVIQGSADLIQLCDAVECILIRLSHLQVVGGNCGLEHVQEDEYDVSSSCPLGLRKLLEDPRILKTGAAIAGDAAAIRRRFADVFPRSCIDLQPLAREHGRATSGFGLGALSDEVLGWPGLALAKSEKSHVRCGDWAAPGPLNADQIFYAAADAWVSRAVFVALFEDHGHFSDADAVHGHLDAVVHFSAAHMDRMSTKMKPVKALITAANSSARTAASDAARAHKLRRAEQSTPLRKTPLYENCIMLDSEGQMLCNCNEKKINWYLDRNLADRVGEDPPTIRLRFKPKGLGHRGSEYYLGVKHNACVVCGSGPDAQAINASVNGPSHPADEPACAAASASAHEKISADPAKKQIGDTPASSSFSADSGVVRHAVIPHAFRRHYPVQLKSRSSHDVVLLCVACTRSCGMADESFRRRIQNRYDIKARDRRMSASNDSSTSADGEVSQIGRLAKALLEHEDKLPVARKKEIEEILLSYVSENEHGWPTIARIRAKCFPDDSGVGSVPLEALHNLAGLATVSSRKVEVPEERWEADVVRKIMRDAAAQARENKTDPAIAELEALMDFSREWRENFVKAMRPRFLPRGWSVDHKPRDPANVVSSESEKLEP